MNRVRAKTTINRALEPGKAKTDTTPAVPPKVQELKVGTVFVPKDQAEYDSLLAAGAIEDWGETDSRAANMGKLGSANEGDGKPGGEGGGDEDGAERAIGGMRSTGSDKSGRQGRVGTGSATSKSGSRAGEEDVI